MELNTSRFGKLNIDTEAILLFPDGIVGFSGHRHWVLLREGKSATFGWLQSMTDPELAFAVVTPSSYVSDYELRFRRDEVSTLPWAATDETLVLAIVSRNDDLLTINLKAPVLINLDRCIGRQLLTCDDQPLQYVLPNQESPLRKSA